MPLPSTPDGTPVSERHELLDALRGFALFGVLLVNLRALSLYDFLPADAKGALPSAGVDALLAPLMAALVDGTSVTLFSLLFGVGFAIQSQRAQGRPGGTARYVRRLLLLLGIGLVHAYVLWWGDILRYYALLGLLLVPLSRLPAWAMAAVGAVIVVLLPVLLQPVLPGLLPPQISSAESAARALEAFQSDRWTTLWQANFERDVRMRIAVWMLPGYVLGRLMIGAALGRSQVLQQPEANLAFWRRLFAGMLAVGGGCTVFFALRDHGVFGESLPWLATDAGRNVLRLMRNATPLAMGLLYLAGFVLVFRRAAWGRALGLLAPLGRMALTNYLAQTVIAVGLFYGVGLGIGPRFGLLGTLVFCVLILVAQIVASRWWLARFRFGPAEWAWRSLTYGQRQPMRRATSV